MSNDKNYYVNESDLVNQLQQWKDSAKDIDQRVVPDGLAQNIQLIATHLLRHKKFVRYSQDDKDDMRQDAIIKCIKNLKNIDTSKGSVFSYLTRVCWTAYIVYLAKYYKDLNAKKQMLVDAIVDVENERGLENVKYLHQLIGDISATLGEYENNKGEGMTTMDND